MKRFLIIGLGLVFLASCGPQKIEQEGSDQTDQDNDGVWELPNYTYTDSLMQGSHKVVFTITSQPDEELPEVVDEDGVKYRDNRFNLLIVKDGRTLFEHSFTKADFKSKLSEDFQKYGIMDGLRYNHAEEGKLYFNTCVSFPESDMSCPFLLIIGPDGSYRLEPDTTFDEDEMPV
jgi:hypothetical protein